MITFVTAALLSIFGLGILTTAYTIGKPRKPLTAGTFVATLIIVGLEAAGVLYLAAH